MRLVTLAASVLALAACGGGEEPSAGPSSGAPIPSGGLTVQEALASDLEGPLMVRGHVVGRGDELHLCSAILESYPPQCGEPSLRIEGTVDAELRSAEGVRWSEAQVSVLGDVEDGAIRVAETST